MLNYFFILSCFSFSFPNMLSINISVNSRFSRRYGLTLKFLANSRAGCIYFNILPSEIVNISLPPHLVHFPCNGGLLYFELQVVHLNPCCENFLKFPLVSLIKCLSITSLATSLTSIALNLEQSSIIFSTFSPIVGNDLYEEFTTV